MLKLTTFHTPTNHYLFDLVHKNKTRPLKKLSIYILNVTIPTKNNPMFKPKNSNPNVVCDYAKFIN